LRVSSNGYSLFTIETLPTITHLPNNERLGEVSRQWKKLSEDKKEAYNLKAEEVTGFIAARCLACKRSMFCIGLSHSCVIPKPAKKTRLRKWTSAKIR